MAKPKKITTRLWISETIDDSEKFTETIRCDDYDKRTFYVANLGDTNTVDVRVYGGPDTTNLTQIGSTVTVGTEDEVTLVVNDHINYIRLGAVCGAGLTTTVSAWLMMFTP